MFIITPVKAGRLFHDGGALVDPQVSLQSQFLTILFSATIGIFTRQILKHETFQGFGATFNRGDYIYMTPFILIGVTLISIMEYWRVVNVGQLPQTSPLFYLDAGVLGCALLALDGSSRLISPNRPSPEDFAKVQGWSCLFLLSFLLLGGARYYFSNWLAPQLAAHAIGSTLSLIGCFVSWKLVPTTGILVAFWVSLLGFLDLIGYFAFVIWR